MGAMVGCCVVLKRKCERGKMRIFDGVGVAKPEMSVIQAGVDVFRDGLWEETLASLVREGNLLQLAVSLSATRIGEGGRRERTRGGWRHQDQYSLVTRTGWHKP